MMMPTRRERSTPTQVPPACKSRPARISPKALAAPPSAPGARGDHRASAAAGRSSNSSRLAAMIQSVPRVRLPGENEQANAQLEAGPANVWICVSTHNRPGRTCPRTS